MKINNLFLIQLGAVVGFGKRSVISLLFVLLGTSGCSVLGQAAKSTLQGTTAAWKLQPLAVRNSYPDWVRSAYYSAELLLSDTQLWQIRVRSPVPLQTPALAELELAYLLDEQWLRQMVPLILLSEQQDDKYYWYEYQLSPASTAFYQQFQQARFSYQRPRFRYLLQPRWPHQTDSTLSARQQLEYRFLPDYGYLSLGQMMRMVNFMPEEEWDWLCGSNEYLFEKGTACGDVVIRDTSGKTSPAD